MIVRNELYIAGAWVASAGQETIDVINSSTEEVMGSVPAGTEVDVAAAVAAAKAAFAGWSTTPAEERGKFLGRIADGIEARMDEIASLVSQEVGTPKSQSLMIQAGLPLLSFRTNASILEDFEVESPLGTATIVREPIGVVGAITPWNYPLHQIAAKVAPALAAGCTVVLKPSEVAPLNAFVLAEIIHDVGVPPGVFNLVTGDGATVGEAITAHPDVDMVSFTGSTRAGKRVSEVATQRVARVALELGGKSPNVILKDADLEKAVRVGVSAAFGNAGQTCSALTRMIVPRSVLGEVERIATEAAEAVVVGDPFEASTAMGPLVSKVQQDRVRGYINTGIEEGAKLLTGGPDQPDGLDQGFFVRPTIFSEVSNDMTIAQEEIFGPVLSIIPVDDEDEAVDVANDTIYGLSGAVWSGDPEKARSVALRLRTGQVFVNGGSFNPLAPFGGYKQSGQGRELGRFGLEEFLEVKAILA